MGLTDPIAPLLLCSAVMLMLMMWRRRQGARPPAKRLEDLDTVQAWQPEAARVLTVAERRAYDLLHQALPGLLVLAQVPLSRFLRVPSRYSHAEWMHRVGSLSADLLVCNAGSRVLAVIDIRPATGQTERSQRRHERMARVLKAAGIEVQVWSEDRLPSATEIRALLGNVLQRGAAPVAQAQAQPTSSKPMPLIPVAEIEELLMHGDAAAQDTSFEPVASAFFDEMEPPRAAARAAA